MGQTIAFVNSFKNTGKTQSALKLAKVYAGYGMQTLLVDLDPQGHLSGLCNLAKPIISWYSQLKEGTKVEVRNVGDKLDILPADKDMAMAEFDSQAATVLDAFKAAFPAIAARYECVILDCPPSIGVLTQLACLQAEIICIPIITDNVYPQGLTKLQTLVAEGAGEAKTIVSFFPKQLNNAVNFERQAAPIQTFLRETVFPEPVLANQSTETSYQQYGLVDTPSLFMALHGV